MKIVIRSTVIGLLLLTACTKLLETSPSVPQVESQDTQEIVQPESPSDGILPAPFYFISQGQIWRGEIDGQGFRQVTHEAQEVVGMDVSPVDGTLAYVSANQLILADTDGSNRLVLTSGVTAQNTEEEMYRVRDEITSPAWAPDGQRLAYGLNGVNLINISDGQSIHLLENPEPPSGGHDMISIYQPRAWTLDGELLFVQDMSSCRVLSVELPVEAEEVRFGGGCDFTWSVDQQSVFTAESGSEYTTFGVWQVEPDTGMVTRLLSAEDAFDWETSVAFPKQAPDGRLFFFFRSADEGAEPTFVAGPLSDLSQMTTLHSVTLPGNLFYSEALWAADASLVILAIRNDSMHILPTDETPMLTLPISGASNLRWGVR